MATLVLLCVCHGAAAQNAALPTAALPTAPVRAAEIPRAEIQAAAAKLRADPNLGGEKKIRTLRWSVSRTPPPTASSPPWIVGLFEFLGQTASVLLWVAGGIAAAIAAVWVIRTLHSRSAPAGAHAPAGTSRVGALDIRPTSLPGDIGAAAFALLEAGRTRDALSLLYRGALSRVVHRHDVAIGEAFTEREALRAVDARLDRTRVAYFADLVELWQRTVYAGEGAPHEPVARLCAEFSPKLDTVDP